MLSAYVRWLKQARLRVCGPVRVRTGPEPVTKLGFA